MPTISSCSTGPLPKDVAVLQAMVTERDAALERNEGEIARRDASIREQGFLIEKLRHQLAVLKRARFGTKSEGLGQLDLLIEALEEEIGAAEGAAPEAAVGEDQAGGGELSAKATSKRKPFPDHLPRE